MPLARAEAREHHPGLMSVTYLDHFGLRRAPFDVTPNPAMMYNSSAQGRLLEWMESGIAARMPMLSLTGDLGTGKTTLVRLLRSRHRNDWIIGMIWPLYSQGEDTRVQARRALGLQDRATDSPAMSSKRIRRYSASMREKGRFTVLIVDEAQELDAEGISGLASLTTEEANGSALTVLLIGRPELNDLLAAPELQALPIREGARAVLPPLSEGETAEYVASRLAKAGAQTPIFDPGAMQVLHEFSQGVPRLINMMANHCLELAAAEKLPQLDAAWVRAVLHEAITVDVLSHPGLTGAQPPQPAGQEAPIAGDGAIPNEAQHSAQSNTADSADPSISFFPVPSEAADMAADARDLPSAAESQEGSAALQVEPIGRDPPASGPDVPLTAFESTSTPRAVAARLPVPQPPLRPAPLEPRRSSGRRRMTWAAAAIALGGGAAFLWLQDGPLHLPTAAIPARPSAEAAAEKTVAQAPRQPAPPAATATLQTSSPVLHPVPITPAPTVAALMKQALEVETRDPAAATITYARAAIRGHSRAAWYLGQFYEVGTGVQPSLGSARLWYAAARDLPASQRRLRALPAAASPAGSPATPVPTFQARLSDGSSEMIWRLPNGATPARFRVEMLGPTGEPLPPQDTTMPGLIVRSPVSAWRVTAISADGRESAPSAMVPMIPAGK